MDGGVPARTAAPKKRPGRPKVAREVFAESAIASAASRRNADKTSTPQRVSTFVLTGNDLNSEMDSSEANLIAISPTTELAVSSPAGSSGAECRRSSRKKIIKFDVRDLLNKHRKPHKIQIEARIDSNAPPTPAVAIATTSRASVAAQSHDPKDFASAGGGVLPATDLSIKQKTFIEKSAIFRRFSVSEQHNKVTATPTQEIFNATMLKSKQNSSLIVAQMESSTACLPLPGFSGGKRATNAASALKLFGGEVAVQRRRGRPPKNKAIVETSPKMQAEKTKGRGKAAAQVITIDDSSNGEQSAQLATPQRGPLRRSRSMMQAGVLPALEKSPTLAAVEGNALQMLNRQQQQRQMQEAQQVQQAKHQQQLQAQQKQQQQQQEDQEAQRQQQQFLEDIIVEISSSSSSASSSSMQAHDDAEDVRQRVDLKHRNFAAYSFLESSSSTSGGGEEPDIVFGGIEEIPADHNAAAAAPSGRSPVTLAGIFNSVTTRVTTASNTNTESTYNVINPPEDTIEFSDSIIIDMTSSPSKNTSRVSSPQSPPSSQSRSHSDNVSSSGGGGSARPGGKERNKLRVKVKRLSLPNSPAKSLCSSASISESEAERERERVFPMAKIAALAVTHEEREELETLPSQGASPPTQASEEVVTSSPPTEEEDIECFELIEVINDDEEEQNTSDRAAMPASEIVQSASCEGGDESRQQREVEQATDIVQVQAQLEPETLVVEESVDSNVDQAPAEVELIETVAPPKPTEEMPPDPVPVPEELVVREGVVEAAEEVSIVSVGAILLEIPPKPAPVIPANTNVSDSCVVEPAPTETISTKTIEPPPPDIAAKTAPEIVVARKERITLPPKKQVSKFKHYQTYNNPPSPPPTALAENKPQPEPTTAAVTVSAPTTPSPAGPAARLFTEANIIENVRVETSTLLDILRTVQSNEAVARRSYAEENAMEATKKDQPSVEKLSEIPCALKDQVVLPPVVAQPVEKDETPLEKVVLLPVENETIAFASVNLSECTRPVEEKEFQVLPLPPVVRLEEQTENSAGVSLQLASESKEKIPSELSGPSEIDRQVTLALSALKNVPNLELPEEPKNAAVLKEAAACSATIRPPTNAEPAVESMILPIATEKQIAEQMPTVADSLVERGLEIETTSKPTVSDTKEPADAAEEPKKSTPSTPIRAKEDNKLISTPASTIKDQIPTKEAERSETAISCTPKPLKKRHGKMQTELEEQRLREEREKNRHPVVEKIDSTLMRPGVSARKERNSDSKSDSEARKRSKKDDQAVKPEESHRKGTRQLKGQRSDEDSRSSSGTPTSKRSDKKTKPKPLTPLSESQSPGGKQKKQRKSKEDMPQVTPTQGGPQPQPAISQLEKASPAVPSESRPDEKLSGGLLRKSERKAFLETEAKAAIESIRKIDDKSSSTLLSTSTDASSSTSTKKKRKKRLKEAFEAALQVAPSGALVAEPTVASEGAASETSSEKAKDDLPISEPIKEAPVEGTIASSPARKHPTSVTSTEEADSLSTNPPRPGAAKSRGHEPDEEPDPLKDIEKFIEAGVNLLKRGYKLDEDSVGDVVPPKSITENDPTPVNMPAAAVLAAESVETPTVEVPATPVPDDKDQTILPATPSKDEELEDEERRRRRDSHMLSLYDTPADTPVATPTASPPPKSPVREEYGTDETALRRSHRIKQITKTPKALVGRGLVRDRERFSLKDDGETKTHYSIDDHLMDLAEVEAKNTKFLKDMEERLSNFQVIKENEYKCERIVSREARRMVCDCFLTAEEEVRGELGCGDDCLNRLLMIECGPDCNVKDRCTNRRFQRFLCSPCRVFRTEKKGFGISADIEILPGEFIMEYVGEVIDGDQFERRRTLYSKEKNRHYYFMALRSDAIIDATIKGNISRFINHSCDPNAETQKWTVNGELRIGFFSRKSILPGEEITFDYQYQRYGREAQRCYCEAANCRGWIGEEPNSDEGEQLCDDSDEDNLAEGLLDDDDDDEDEDTDDSGADAEDVQKKLEIAAAKANLMPLVGDDSRSKAEKRRKVGGGAAGDDDDFSNNKLKQLLNKMAEKVAKKKALKSGGVQATDDKKRRRRGKAAIGKIASSAQSRYLEDPDIEDEVSFLSRCGLKNQSDTLRLSRLMVRAKLPQTRLNMLRILRGGDLPCRRLFLDYHGLRLLHGWMSEDGGSDLNIRLALLETLECLPIVNKTVLTDTKVYQAVRNWCNSAGGGIAVGSTAAAVAASASPSDESSKESSSNSSQLPATGSGLVSAPVSDLVAPATVSASGSTIGGTPATAPATVVATATTEEEQSVLQKLAAKLTATWDSLPEIFRIPKRERIEQMKEHEREADRQYAASSVEEESGNNRLNSVDRYQRDRFGRNGAMAVSRFSRPHPGNNGKDGRTITTISCGGGGGGSGSGTSDPRRRISGADGATGTSSTFDSSLKHLSKEQRREMFAAKVARDEAEKRLAEERRDFETKCRFFGLDPKKTRPGDMPFCVLPSTGQWYSVSRQPIITPPSYAHVQVPVKPKSTDPSDYRLPAAVHTLPPNWKFAITQQGFIYYFHVLLRVPQWEPPSPSQLIEANAAENSDSASQSDEANQLVDSSGEDDDELIKGMDFDKLKAYIEQKVENRRHKRYGRLVGERGISPRREEDRIYNQMEVRKYKENKEKIRKRKEEIRRRRAVAISMGLPHPTDDGATPTTEGSALSNKTPMQKDEEPKASFLPIQDYLLSSDEEATIKEECNNSPLLEKIVQGDKIVDELDALTTKRQLKRPLPPHREPTGEASGSGTAGTSSGSSASGSAMDKYEYKKRKLERKEKSKKSSKEADSKYRKLKEKFRCEIAGLIVAHLRPYRKESCPLGRIRSDEDFTHLAKKLTHFVMVKELKYCESVGQTLDVTESVKSKSREFIKKYMAKYGAVYQKPRNDPEFKDIPLTL